MLFSNGLFIEHLNSAKVQFFITIQRGIYYRWRNMRSYFLIYPIFKNMNIVK